MAIFFSVLAGVSIIQADDFAHPHEYVEEVLENLKNQKIGLSEGINGHITKFQNLKNQLPASEVEFKGLIDAGIIALQKMKDDKDDSKLADLSALGVKFSGYYLANKQALDATPESDLSQAFYAFLGRDPVEGGGPPQRFFYYLLDEIFYSYLHYYNIEEFGTVVPNYAKTAMVDSLSWVTESGNETGEDHANANLIYYFGELWAEVSPRLDALSANQRETVLTQLESALEDNDQFEDEIENKAQQNLAAARVRFPEN